MSKRNKKNVSIRSRVPEKPKSLLQRVAGIHSVSLLKLTLTITALVIVICQPDYNN